MRRPSGSGLGSCRWAAGAEASIRSTSSTTAALAARASWTRLAPSSAWATCSRPTRPRQRLRGARRRSGPGPGPGGPLRRGGGRQRPFRDPRPGRYWHATWAFALEPLPRSRARLIARGRAAYPSSGRVHAPGRSRRTPMMQRVQLRNLARRAEGRLPATDWRDALAGLGGAGSWPGPPPRPFLRAAAWRLGAPGHRRRGRPVPGGRAHPRAALGLDPRHRDRRARRGGLALGGADRRGPGRLLQLHVAREPGGLRRARRRADPPRVAGPRRRSPGAAPVRPAVRDRGGGAGPPPAGLRRPGRGGAGRRAPLGRGELAAARPRPSTRGAPAS